MRKKILFFVICISFCFLITPVEAKNKNTFSSIISNSIYMLEEEEEFDGISNIEESGIDMDKYNQKQSCESILGSRDDPDYENSVLWLIDKALQVIQILGPIMVVVLSSIDFARVVINGDDDSMAKAGKKLGIRLALAVTLFFIPVLVNVVLDVFGLTGSSCNIQ